MQDLLRIPKIQRMLYMRLFLSINSYPGVVTEETFTEDMYAPSPMAAGLPRGAQLDASNLSPTNLSGRAIHSNEATHLLRESQDISEMIMSNLQPLQPISGAAMNANHSDLAFDPTSNTNAEMIMETV